MITSLEIWTQDKKLFCRHLFPERSIILNLYILIWALIGLKSGQIIDAVGSIHVNTTAQATVHFCWLENKKKYCEGLILF